MPRTSPKYILLASSTNKSLHSLKPLKKASIHNKDMPVFQSTRNKSQQLKSMGNSQHFKPLTKQIKNEIERVRLDLSQSMNDIIFQTKKNQIFKQLNNILQSQMKEIEESQKYLKQVENQQNLKKAHKIQYDIQQILQKQNEEVAKITILKEQIASARTDRVVFSNLFKKIEKQIKQHEELYKEDIMKTQFNREKKAQKNLKQVKIIKNESNDEELREQYISNKKVGSSRQVLNSESKLFVTTLQQKGTIYKKHSNYKPICNEMTSSNRLKQMTEEVQTKIDKIIKITQCSTSEQTIDYYSVIEEQNKKLEDVITDEETKIQSIEEQIEKIKLEKRISGIYESDRIYNQSRKYIESCKNIGKNGQKIDSDSLLLRQIFKQLGISHPESDKCISINQDTLCALQEKINQFCKANIFKRMEQHLITSSNSVQQELDGIFNKMEKFDSCDRFLNKIQLQTEYLKEIARSKKIVKNTKKLNVFP